VAAVCASDPSEAVVEDAAIEVTVDDHFDIRTKKSILFGKTVVVNLFKSLEMILKIRSIRMGLSSPLRGFCDLFLKQRRCTMSVNWSGFN
jgi:hypothetical protein